MIVMENETHYLLIDQHEHALLSGCFAHYLHPKYPEHHYELSLATALHDTSWIDLDYDLPWDEINKKPYDFITLPISIRLPMYQKGIDKLEKLTTYGSYLTSLHYCSFFKKNTTDAEVITFLQAEKERRERLKKSFKHPKKDTDFFWLQFFDDLSLYTCLNPPGVSKENEHSWYKNGIFNKALNLNVQVKWLNERTILVEPFIFVEPFQAKIHYRKCRKSLGHLDPDLHTIYSKTITFISEESLYTGI